MKRKKGMRIPGKRWVVGLLAFFALGACAGAGAETVREETGAEIAREITGECEIIPGCSKKDFQKALDGDYRTYWHSLAGKRATIEVRLPEGEEAGGVWFQWFDHPHAIALEVKDEAGQWQEVSCSAGEFLSDYLPLPKGTREFRAVNPRNAKKSPPIPLAEFHVYSRGELPPEVQVWRGPAEKADLLMLVAHPDDEVLWFGGVLPVYAGVEKKEVQVCLMTPTLPRRRLEFLDCLWTCGVRNYPEIGYLRDVYAGTLREQYAKWDQAGVQKLITGWIRRFQPDVMITHDFNGEYGHGAHRVCADATAACLELAANPKKFRESADRYGTWDVPKCYIHLYPENVIDFEWKEPLAEFGGRTAFEVARDGFACHISQQETDYRVEDFGPWDCSRFGLYRSLVGPDREHNDLFENLRSTVRDEEE